MLFESCLVAAEYNMLLDLLQTCGLSISMYCDVQVRRICEETMKNVHPVYNIKVDSIHCETKKRAAVLSPVTCVFIGRFS